MATVLITGVAGFIGSSLAHALLAQGAHVRGLDDFSTGHLTNLETCASQINLLRGSIEDRDLVAHACRGVDYVFHEAALPSVSLSVADPLGTNGPNLLGTLNLLEAARHAKVRRFLYAASSAAYGDSPQLPKSEDMTPDPLSPYAVQKLAGEYYLATYARMYNLQTVGLRYFNIFGPRQDPSSQYSGVLARFISQMTNGETPTIFGDGTTSRDFTYIDNVVNANLLAAKAPDHISGKVFNVATGRQTTLLTAFETIRTLVGFHGDARFLAERAGDIKHSVGDIRRAQNAFGYRVTTGFEEGLKHTVQWAQQRSVPALSF